MARLSELVTLARSDSNRLRTQRDERQPATVTQLAQLIGKLESMFGDNSWTGSVDSNGLVSVNVDDVRFELTPLGDLRAINTRDNRRAILHRPSDLLEVCDVS